MIPGSGGCFSLFFKHEDALFPIIDDILVHNDLLEILEFRQIVHNVEHGRFQYRAQSSGSCFASQSFCSHGSKGFIGETQLDVLEPEELLVLLDESILRLQEYAHECILVQLVQRGRYRQSTDELGYQAVMDQVFRLNVSEYV